MCYVQYLASEEVLHHVVVRRHLGTGLASRPPGQHDMMKNN